MVAQSTYVYINKKVYETGKKASEDFTKTMPVIFNKFLPKWNYKFNYKEKYHYML